MYKRQGHAPRGEGMERARGRRTAASVTCGAARLRYFPDADEAGDRSDVAAHALRRGYDATTHLSHDPQSPDGDDAVPGR